MGAARVLESRLGVGLDEGQPIFAASLAPLLAGARARGMADSFDLLGQAAVLIDEEGAALYVSERAQRLFGPELTLSRGRLRTADLTSDAALQAAVNAALAGRVNNAGPIFLTRSEGQPELSLRVVAIGLGNESAQLLRAIILIDCAGASPIQRLI